MNKHTVSMHFVRAAVANLSPGQRQVALAAAGIAPELLAAPEARVPAQAFSALWLAVAEALDDEFFGLDSRRMKMGSFALLCHAVLPCERMDRAVRLMLRGHNAFLDDVTGELSIDGDKAVITLANRVAGADARRFAAETFLVMVHGLMCWLSGRRIPITSAQFAWPQPAHALEYTVMYSPHVSFDAPATAIRFDAAVLDAPIVQTAQTLKTFLRSAPQSVFLKYRNEAGWTARVRRRLRGSIGQHDWPVLEDLADEFHVAPTTLRRRLEAEGSSYGRIKEDLRRDAAIHHLCNTPLSVAEIAIRLGFQEPSAFHRAFKKWVGVQPGQYRQRAKV